MGLVEEIRNGLKGLEDEAENIKHTSLSTVVPMLVEKLT